MERSGKIGEGGCEFEYSLPDQPGVMADKFLNKARPARKDQKLFKKLAGGHKISDAEERQLIAAIDKLWRLREEASGMDDVEGEKQIGYVYVLVSKILEYARTIKAFLREAAEARAKMASLGQEDGGFGKFRSECEMKTLAIRQNRVMIEDIQAELKKIPLDHSGTFLAGKILAILAPLGLLTSFHPVEKTGDEGLIMDRQAQVAKGVSRTIAMGSEEDLAGYGSDDEYDEDDWLEDEKTAGGGHGGLTGLDDDKPNMNDGAESEEDGIRGGADAFGKFEFTSEKYRRLLDGRLWVTKVDKPIESGAELRSFDVYDDAEKDVAAKATVNINHITSNKSYRLPHPIGTRVINVHVEPESLEFTQSNHDLLIFGQSGDYSAKVSYELVVVETRFDSGTHFSPGAETLGPDAQKALDRMRNSPGFTEDIMRDYLSNYTYVTSRQLQKLLDRIPGSYQKKMEHIRFGDCDMLSDHGAYLMQRAGVSAMTTLGFMDMGENRLSTENAHGQILFSTDYGGELKEFEATGAASIHGSFKGVRFKSGDYAKLEAIVEQIKAASSDDARIQGYKNFDQKLREILSKKDYQRFRLHGEMADFASTMKDMAEQLMKDDGLKKVVDVMAKANSPGPGAMPPEKSWLDQLDKDIEDALGSPGVYIFRALFILFAVAMFAGAGVGVAKLHGLEVGRQERKIKDRIRGVAERMLRDSPGDAGEVDEIIGYDTKSVSFREMIPKELYDQASPEVRRAFHLMVSIIEFIRPEYLIMYYFHGKSRLENMLKRLDQNGYDSRRIMAYFKESFESPKFRKMADRRRESDKSEILKNASDTAAKFVNRFSNSKPSTHAKIQTSILNLHRIGDKEVKRSKTALPNSPFPSGERRSYNSGDDVRQLDWNAFAKDQLLVKVPETQAEVMPQAKDRYVLMIDVVSANNDDLSRLLAFFYYVQQYPRQVGITAIELYAYGRRLNFDEAPMQTGKGSGSNNLLRKLCVAGPEGRKNAQAFVKNLVDLKWKYTWHHKIQVHEKYDLVRPRLYGKAYRRVKAKKAKERLLYIGSDFHSESCDLCDSFFFGNDGVGYDDGYEEAA